MPNPNFPGPNLDRIIENDPMIVKINVDTNEIGGRMASMPKDFKNQNTIKHSK
jgi:hypothetical protein